MCIRDRSTLFNAITSTKNAEAANYPFCTIEPNSGIVAVPDKRLDKLAEVWQTNKKTPAIVEFVDIAGLVKGCLLYTSPSPRDGLLSRMPSSA